MRARTLVPVLLVATLGGCVKNDASIEMAGICAFTTDCSFSGTCTQGLSYKPWTDPVGGGRLVLFVQFNNQLPNNADASVGRANTNDARVQQYQITYSGGLIPSAMIDVQLDVPANGSAVLPVYVVPPGSTAATAVAALGSATPGTPVVAHVIAFGKYMNGSTFETGEYDIAFNICSGCAATWCGGLPIVCPWEGQIGSCG